MSRYRLFTPFFVGARGGVYVHGQYVCVQYVCVYSMCVCTVCVGTVSLCVGTVNVRKGACVCSKCVRGGRVHSIQDSFSCRN